MKKVRINKEKTKQILMITAGTVVCVGVSIIIGKKINNRIKVSNELGEKILKAFKMSSNSKEIVEDGLVAWIDYDTDELVCTIDVSDGNVGELLDLMKKAENFFTENLAF